MLNKAFEPGIKQAQSNKLGRVLNRITPLQKEYKHPQKNVKKSENKSIINIKTQQNTLVQIKSNQKSLVLVGGAIYCKNVTRVHANKLNMQA